MWGMTQKRITDVGWLMSFTWFLESKEHICLLVPDSTGQYRAVLGSTGRAVNADRIGGASPLFVWLLYHPLLGCQDIDVFAIFILGLLILGLGQVRGLV